jgi:hypothetical protein
MKSTREVYWEWAWAFRDTTALCVVLQTILTLSLAQRKDLLSLSRTQSPVVRGSYLETTVTTLDTLILVPLSPTRRLNDVRYTTYTLRDLISDYQPTFLSPIQCSIVALATRISPSTTAEEYDTILRQSVSKEISAAITRFAGARLDFRCIFGSDLHEREIPFSDRLAADPEVASDTFQIFCRVKREITDMLVFPSFGRKTVGRVVESHFWDSYYLAGSTFKHECEADSSQVTPGDCLRLYEETGGYVEGPVEMRTAWKYAQIGPRVYYARGGSVVPASQYLQPIVNRIIDAFPETHRKNRFSPPQDRLEEDDVEVIYDYTSFTSALDHVVEFVRQLAIFFRGTPIWLVDVVEGPQQIDFGDLLDRYNVECNEYRDFDTTRVLPTGVEAPILQHTCGMLGVEGNIFLATLLHGIHLRFIAGLNRSRCVGDDARFHHGTIDGTLSGDERQVLGWQLNGVGLTNDEKLAIFESGVDPVSQAFRYVKRPIWRDHDIMIEGVMFDIPSLIPLFRLEDPFHTVIPTATHPCRSTFRSIIRMLRVLKLHNLSMETEPESIMVLSRHVFHLIDEMRRQDPSGTYSPHSSSGSRFGYRLPPTVEWGVTDYETWFVDSLDWMQKIRFMKKGGADEDGSCDGRVGSTMVRETSKGRSFLEKMGYLERVELYDEVSLADVGKEEMKEYVDGDYSAVCEYYVKKEIPSWYCRIPRTL